MLTERFIAGIESVPNVRLVGPVTADPERRVGTFGLVVDGGNTAALARELGSRGGYTWNGNFYALGVVRHLGLDTEAGLLRASLVHYNTAHDVDRLLSELEDIATQGKA